MASSLDGRDDLGTFVRAPAGCNAYRQRSATAYLRAFIARVVALALAFVAFITLAFVYFRFGFDWPARPDVGPAAAHLRPARLALVLFAPGASSSMKGSTPPPASPSPRALARGPVLGSAGAGTSKPLLRRKAPSKALSDSSPNFTTDRGTILRYRCTTPDFPRSHRPPNGLGT